MCGVLPLSPSGLRNQLQQFSQKLNYKEIGTKSAESKLIIVLYYKLVQQAVHFNCASNFDF
jgi:hypothetical protein